MENETPEIDFHELAKRALENDNKLNTEPLHKGNYHYEFVLNGTYFLFESDGWTWNWEYRPTDSEDTI